ncbi:unnamed protein product [Heterobilharzia americana]|nr:unnamed protein product [Heterobilharzia americana]
MRAPLTKTLESRAMGIYCVYNTRIQDPNVVIHHLTSLGNGSESSNFTLRVSGDPMDSSHELDGVGIALSCRAGSVLVNWIPIDSRSFTVRVNRSVRTRKDRETR